jgi:hypothetical protein
MIFVSNGGGPNYFNEFTGGADRAYNSFYAALQRWNRYEFVHSPSQADLIFEICSIASASDVSGTDGSVSTVYNPQLILRIRDPKTNAVLWTTTANVRAAGRQKTRDKEFDQSVAVLVDKLAQTTGEHLSPDQLKDISDNSRWSTTGRNVFIGVAIALAAAGTGAFVYEATHRNTPTLPTLPPPCADPPFCPVPAAR